LDVKRQKKLKRGQNRVIRKGLAHPRTKPGKLGLQVWARKLRRRGWSYAAIAKELGIERRTAAHYCSRRIAWKKRKPKTTKSSVAPVQSDSIVGQCPSVSAASDE
jgi:hypothetical protein